MGLLAQKLVIEQRRVQSKICVYANYRMVQIEVFAVTKQEICKFLLTEYTPTIPRFKVQN